MTKEEIENKIEELRDEIWELECADNVDYAEIEKRNTEIDKLERLTPDPIEFKLEVTIKGTVSVLADTLEDAINEAYDACKNHEFIAVQSVEVDEE